MSAQERTAPASVLHTTIEWGVPPPASHPSKVREFLCVSFAGILDQDDADRVGIASHELLENILKYSNGGMSSFALVLSRRGEAGHVAIRTRNQVTVERLREAEAHIRHIGTASAEVYDELVASSPDRAGSGLGLARVRVEAEMDVACLADDLTLTITVEGTVALRGWPC